MNPLYELIDEEVWLLMFFNSENFEGRNKRVFMTYKHSTRLWFSFVFSSLIINEFLKIE